MTTSDAKAAVRDYWDKGSCGEVYAEGESPAERLEARSRARYELEPYIPAFAGFDDGRGKDVLEIGVGGGVDHERWARSGPRSLTGVDLTETAIRDTRERLAFYGLTSDLRVADAEALPFPDDSFDLVYSWGVIHHSPDTRKAAQEILRVLRPGGEARVMIYHKRSMVGYMLWARYGLMKGRPWRSLADIYAHHLESPGTKAFTVADARSLFSGASVVRPWVQLTFGDLLEGAVGQRHRGPLLSAAKALYPRGLIRRFLPGHGLDLLIRVIK